METFSPALLPALDMLQLQDGDRSFPRAPAAPRQGQGAPEPSQQSFPSLGWLSPSPVAVGARRGAGSTRHKAPEVNPVLLGHHSCSSGRISLLSQDFHPGPSSSGRDLSGRAAYVILTFQDPSQLLPACSASPGNNRCWLPLSLTQDFLTAGTEAFLLPVAPRTALSHQGLQEEEKLLQRSELG